MSAQSTSSIDKATLRQERVEAISAIEGQFLTDEQRQRFNTWEKVGLSPEQQRSEILSLYRSGTSVK